MKVYLGAYQSERYTIRRLLSRNTKEEELKIKYVGILGFGRDKTQEKKKEDKRARKREKKNF